MPPSSHTPDSYGAHERAGDLYAVLGVSPDADIGELTSAYRRRLRQLHPDTRRQHRTDQELGQLTSLKQAPAYPEGYDPKVVKVWVPNFEQYKKLHAAWMDDWNKTYGYRQ